MAKTAKDMPGQSLPKPSRPGTGIGNGSQAVNRQTLTARPSIHCRPLPHSSAASMEIPGPKHGAILRQWCKFASHDHLLSTSCINWVIICSGSFLQPIETPNPGKTRSFALIGTSFRVAPSVGTSPAIYSEQNNAGTATNALHGILALMPDNSPRHDHSYIEYQLHNTL